MNSGQDGYAEKEFSIGPELVCRIGISVNYSDGGMLNVEAKSFSAIRKATRDTHSARSVKDAIEEIVDELTKEANPYSYLRLSGTNYGKCDAKGEVACYECCTYEHLPKCSAHESAVPESSLQASEIAEFGRGFRIVLKEGIRELVNEA